MKIKTWIVSTVVATLAISILIVWIVFSLLQDLEREAANSRVYHEIRWKTHALGLLTARMRNSPGPTRIRQVREIRASLEALLGTLAPSDAGAETLVRQIRTDSRELGYSLEKLIAISLAPGGPTEAERYEVLYSQLSMKTQFIVEDTRRLVAISEARMESSRRNAVFLAVALIVALLSINALLSIFTGRKIVRSQESLRQALSKAEEGDRLLSAFMEYVPEGIVMADAGLNVTKASRDSRERFGISPSVTGMDGIAAQTAVFHADGKTPMAFEELPLVRAVRSGEVLRDAEIVQADVRGERVDMLCTAGPIRDASGRIIGGIVASRDITGRRQAEEALRRLSQFPEQDPYPVLRCALDGTLLYANSSARDWLEATGWRAGSHLPDAVRGAVTEACGRELAVETEVTGMDGRTIGLSAVRPPGEEYVNIYGIDLTARKRAALALADSESRYRELLDTANSIILRLDDRWIIRFVNDYGLRFFGYAAEELLGRDLETLTRSIPSHPEKHAQIPGENVRKDGKTVWVAWTHKAILDGQGNIREILAIGNDITALKEAEAAVRASEGRVRRKMDAVLSPEGDLCVLALADLVDIPALRDLMDDFYEVARIPMSILDTEGRLLVGVGWQDICTRFHRADPAASRNCLESDTLLTAGLAQGECRLYKCRNNLWDMATPIVVAGRHVGNIFTGQFFFEDETVDREFFRAQALERGFDEGEYLDALDRVPRISRETVDRGMSFFRKLAGMLSQHGYSNAQLARLLAERDRLTDSLRESRAKLDAALNSMTDAVFISDAEGRFVHFNDAFATYHRFRNRDECARTFEEHPGILDVLLDNGESAPKETWAVSRALRGETDTNAEYTLRREDTGETWVGSYSFAPIRDGDGAVVGSVVAARDVTERKRAEEALRASEERLRSLLGEKEVLLKEVHHRVKNNLQVISSLVALQAEAIQDASVRAVFQDVTHRVRSIAIVHEKLYQTPDLARIEFSEYAESLLDYLWRAHGMGGAGIRLVKDLTPVWLSVNAAVPSGLILNELVSNALKHAFRNRTDGSVAVSLRRGAQDEVSLRVRDDGVGLPAGFDLSQSRSLGLRLVQMLARQLHASVDIESGSGTGFTITFGGKKA